ncbi:hypothetical protein JVU11DRAFT_8040 [Chiua virens]|nr:hypothetical protein JVU11DRAFT_8040 [Chiua virens]
MGLPPHVPPYLASSSIMSSHPNPDCYGHQGHIYYENGSGPPVSRQSRSPEQSWTSSTPIDDQIGYSQPYQSVDPVRVQLEAHDVEDMSYSINQSESNLLPQVPGVRTDATYTNDDIPLQPSIYFPYDPLIYGQFQHQSGYAPYESYYDPQSYVPNAQTSSNFAQGFPPQTSHGPLASNYLYPSSTQLLPLDLGGPMYLTNPDAPPLPANFSQDGVNTATLELPNANTRRHSHTLPVATSSSNQSSVAGPNRLQPSLPERRRLLPQAADEEQSTARRVIPRSDRAWSVHSTDSYIPGRGKVIPQERYTSNTITSYNTPAPRARITFNLESPDQPGIPITDILSQTGNFARLLNRTETFDMGKLTFTLRILVSLIFDWWYDLWLNIRPPGRQWPGYKPWTKTISAKDWKKNRGPVSRAKLAEVVAKAVRDLIKVGITTVGLPSELGLILSYQKRRNERCHAEYAAEWNVGQDGIQLGQICLVALWQVSRGSWQPQLCLIEPRR